jgi:hypothetical protein
MNLGQWLKADSKLDLGERLGRFFNGSSGEVWHRHLSEPERQLQPENCKRRKRQAQPAEQCEESS